MDREAIAAAAAELLVAVAPVDVRGLGDDELLLHAGEVERVGRLVDALRVAAAGEVEHRSRRSLGVEGLARRRGCARAAHLLERVTRVSQSEASRRIRVGRELRADEHLDGTPMPLPHPHVSAALEAGEIGVDAALAIASNLALGARDASPDALDAAEQSLVAEATHQSADLVMVQAIVWRAAIAPDGAAPRAERIRERRRFRIGQTDIDGLTPFSGLAEPVFAATLRAAISERTAPDRAPRFLDPADAVDDSGLFRDDGRTSEQRAYDVLEGLLTAGMRADAVERGPLHSTATVNVVVTAADLDAQSGPAWLDDVREPISAAMAGTVACDGGMRVVAVDAVGQPLWIGRRERLFTAAQRAALAVRDGGCVFPGCTAPPSWSQAHHIVHWNKGGATDITNGVLLCAFHHRLLHDGQYSLRMTREGPEMLSPRWLDPEQRWRPVGKRRWATSAA